MTFVPASCVVPTLTPGVTEGTKDLSVTAKGSVECLAQTSDIDKSHSPSSWRDTLRKKWIQKDLLARAVCIPAQNEMQGAKRFIWGQGTDNCSLRLTFQTSNILTSRSGVTLFVETEVYPVHMSRMKHRMKRKIDSER